MTTKFTPAQLRQMSDEWMAVATLTAHRNGHMLRQAADDAEDAERYESLKKITPYRFKKMQDACAIDAMDVVYFDKKKFDDLVDSARKEPK